jgi:type IV pilus assembly protein PilC
MSLFSKKKKYLPSDEVSAFCSQISLILDAGIPLYDGIDSLVESIEDGKGQKAFIQISEKVKETGSLYEAVKEAGFFPEYMVNMIHIGEETGKTDDVLKSLSIYYERESKVLKTVKSAVTYPVLLIAMMAAVILLLVTRVMPIFEDIFINLGTDMSDSGRRIMNLGMLLGQISFAFIAAVLMLIIVFYLISKMGHGNKLRNLLFSLPILNRVNKKISGGRFAAVISMMLSSGYSLEKALEMAPTIVEDEYTKEKIALCAELVKEGKSFPEALLEIGIFTKMQSRIISVGFKAGQLDQVMEKISKTYEEEVDESIEKLVSYIEPCLVGILSIIIGGILISVMLPLASIMSSVG